jgi:AraC family transcriptional regulator of adaptative response / DNA-3-methyladenine glycosylase II
MAMKALDSTICAEAAQQGFRPCLRCRPESAPQSPAWRGTNTTTERGLKLIAEGYLNHHSLSQLASRLGVGERYLRKLFQQKLGVAPTAIAQTQRLHLAQKLLLETDLPITEIAHASGFGSLRRFNSASRSAFGCAPGALRRRRSITTVAGGFLLELSYRAPYDWPGVIGFFRRHEVAGMEKSDDDGYRRNLRTPGGHAQLRLWPHPKKSALKLELKLSDNSELMAIVAMVRRMFDLDAQPHDIGAALSADSLLSPLVQACPGVRSPVIASVFESTVRAVLGQQVSIDAARGLCAKLIDLCHSYIEVDGQRLAVFPTPEQLVRVPEKALGMPATRRRTLHAVGEYFTDRDDSDRTRVLDDLGAIAGIGPWTTRMVAMRGFADPDQFPDTDLVLIKACQRLAAIEKKQFAQRAEQWKPWRSYAANLLWRSISL